MKIFYAFFLINFVDSFYITCRFNFGIDWFVIGRVYTCDVISMNFNDDSLQITGYEGEHLSANSSSDVKMIYFRNNYCPDFNLTFVPKGFLNFFPNVIALYFSKCSIDFLRGSELDEYQNLQWFSIEYSNLTRLPGNLFASTLDMRYLNFGDNKIEHVGENLLHNLQQLEQVRFLRNICISSEARNPLQIPSIVEALNSQCPDIEFETTTELITLSTSTPEISSTFSPTSTPEITSTSPNSSPTTTISVTTQTNEPPKCEINNVEDFVCNLEEEVENLRENDAKLLEENANLRNKIENLEQSNQNLVENNEKLSSQVKELKNEIEKIHANLFDLEHIIIDCCYFGQKFKNENQIQ